MNRIKQLYLILFIFIFIHSTGTSAEKPNIIIILADDLGYNDLGYKGSEILTPNIDALAKQAVQFDDYYGLPVCSPARAALMTGRYPMRYGLQTLVIFPSHTYGLPTDEQTLPELLKEAGYTTAMVGKWHLGHANKKYWPQNRGFDSFYGSVIGEVDYFTKKRGGIVDWQRNGLFFEEEGYLTDLIGDESVRLIKEQDPSKPFFLYFASLAPHTPYQVPQKYLDRYPEYLFDSKTRRAYAAMISALDDQVGRIVETLKEKGMFDNTIIFFTTDNGGVVESQFSQAMLKSKIESDKGMSLKSLAPPASNGDFARGKGSLHEGGVRLPAFLFWPQKLKPATITEPVGHVDIVPTLLDIAGWTGKTNKPLDGKDIMGLLTGREQTIDRDLLINVEAFRGAIRKGRWKLIKVATLPGKIELYDLSNDPGEKNNVASLHPEIVRELEALLIQYAKEQKPSKWIKAQFKHIGSRGKTILDPDFDVDDGGLPNEKPKLPKE